jgi:hypothetical protein
MSVTILDFYKGNLPHPKAVPFVKKEVWNNTAADDVVVNPKTGYKLLVTDIHFLMDSDFDLGTNKLQFENITDESLDAGTKLQAGNPAALAALSSDTVENLMGSGSYLVRMRLKKPPECTHSGEETFAITYTGPGGLAGGTLTIIIFGFTWLESED